MGAITAEVDVVEMEGMVVLAGVLVAMASLDRPQAPNQSINSARRQGIQSPVAGNSLIVTALGKTR
jgi:hypothetical protein